MNRKYKILISQVYLDKTNKTIYYAKKEFF